MTVDSKELNLELGCGFHPKTISDLLTEVSVIDNLPHQFSDINELVDLLQQELKKIDAFKRELPLCMLLLNDAIERLKKKKNDQCNKRRKVVTEEEFASFNNSDENAEAKRSDNCSDKKNWMNSAQLWSSPFVYNNKIDRARIQDSFLNQKSMNEENDNRRAKMCMMEMWDQRNREDVSVPLKKSGEAKVKIEDDLAVDVLSLSIPVVGHDGGTSSGALSDGSPQPQRQQQQQGKKQRRCWSPDLHRRFINALQQLGGPHAATPKQIRELMHVEGLTNDEVKSHLQKYRLHVRKLPSCSSAPMNLDWLKSAQSCDIQMFKNRHSLSPEGPFEGEVRKPRSENSISACN